MYPTKEQLESKWWHRLVKVLIILATVTSFIFAIGVFVDEFWEPHQFLLSFESGYNEIKVKEQKLEDHDVPSFAVINRIKHKNPPVLSKNSFSVGVLWGGEKPESKKLYPKEFIETQCRGELLSYSPECFRKIVENYPSWKIKSWTSTYPSVILVFLIVPITYFGLWLFYKKIILYIAFGKK